MVKEKKATRDYERDKRAGTLEGRRWKDYQKQYEENGTGFEKSTEANSGEVSSGRPVDIKRVQKATYDYVYNKTLPGLIQYAERHDNPRINESWAKHEAEKQAKDDSIAVYNSLRGLESLAKRNGTNFVLAEEGSFSDVYRNYESASSNGIGQGKYKGIMPNTNPRSRENRAYTKQHGEQSFSLGYELPKEIIAGLNRRKRKA